MNKIIDFWLTLLAGIFLGGGVMLLYLHTPFNNYQTISELRADYKRCKADTLPEFDCVLVTMAVSKDFAERQ